MNEVYQTGQTINDPNGTAMLLKDGQLQQAYFDYYQPIRDAKDLVIGLLVIMNDVTESVLNRQAANQLAWQLRLVISSANLGTWTMDVVTRSFTLSPLCYPNAGGVGCYLLHAETTSTTPPPINYQVPPASA